MRLSAAPPQGGAEDSPVSCPPPVVVVLLAGRGGALAPTPPPNSAFITISSSSSSLSSTVVVGCRCGVGRWLVGGVSSMTRGEADGEARRPPTSGLPSDFLGLNISITSSPSANIAAMLRGLCWWWLCPPPPPPPPLWACIAFRCKKFLWAIRKATSLRTASASASPPPSTPLDLCVRYRVGEPCSASSRRLFASSLRESNVSSLRRVLAAAAFSMATLLCVAAKRWIVKMLLWRLAS